MFKSHPLVLPGTVFSDPVLVLNGVKQGGVISPVLFCLYLNGLPVRLAAAVWLFR